MVYFYNTNLIFAAAVAMVMGFTGYSLSKNGEIAAASGLVAAIIFDLVMRLRNREEEYAVISPTAGAHLMFVPVWIFGLVVGGIGFLIWMEWV